MTRDPIAQVASDLNAMMSWSIRRRIDRGRAEANVGKGLFGPFEFLLSDIDAIRR
ncbi:hypothetical protein EV561_106251 [Rhizobium sp. BK376]|nr:hypothetical protein EV561_106251 [Rhizobium sp. BK376]